MKEIVEANGGVFRCRFTTERDETPRIKNIIAKDAEEAKSHLQKVFGTIVAFTVLAYCC